MTEEEKKAAEAAEAEAKVKAEADAAKADDAGGDEKKNNDAEIEAALKGEREARLKAEADLEETRKKARERIKERKESGEPSDDDKPITKTDVQSMIEEVRETTRRELQESRALEIAGVLSESDSEANLTLEVWKNRKLQGSLEEQMREAHAIATYKKTSALNSELKRALGNKDTISKDGANAKRNPAPANEPKINEVDKTAIVGMTWDAARGAYRKLIAGGTTVFWVSRDLKKRWTEKVQK